LAQVQGGPQQRLKATARRSLALALSASGSFGRAASLRSEDAASAGATDSEGDSLATDEGSSKRKLGGRKGAGTALTCDNALWPLAAGCRL
jgi:hypothetical protein